MIRGLLFALMAMPVLAAPLVPDPPLINADAYILIDHATGTVIAEKQADQRLPPASLTKLMTAYILAEEVSQGRLNLEDSVTVSRNAWSQNPTFSGSSLMWIEPGKTVTVAELEKGIVISSGNDATVAIAEHIAGTEAAFADLMNQYAQELGLSATHYRNSHGLPAEGHETSARDLAALASATIRNHPDRYAIYKQQTFTYNNISQRNRNKLLFEDPTVDGLKTGYTSVAGYGLVASAERNGMRLVSVVLGSASTRSRAVETKSLLNYGFRFFETLSPLKAGQELGIAPVWQGLSDTVRVGVASDITLTAARSKQTPAISYAVDEALRAPIEAGQTLGDVTVSVEGEILAQLPLVALDAVEQAGFFARLWDAFLLWLNGLFG